MWSLVSKFPESLDLCRHVTWQGSHADGGAGACASLFSEDVDHQITEAVYDFGVLRESEDRIHHAECTDESRDAVETPDPCPHCGQYVDAALTCRCPTLFDREVFAYDPLMSGDASGIRGVCPATYSIFQLCECRRMWLLEEEVCEAQSPVP